MAQKSTVYGLYSYDPGPRPQLRVTPRCQRSAAAFALLHPPASAPPEPLYRPDSVQPTEHSTTAEPPSPPFAVWRHRLPPNPSSTPALAGTSVAFDSFNENEIERSLAEITHQR